ncbi:unnamed protein product [Adineta steineri]|uniref:Uncharacterized protein n=2 Tax=Adineta steineri TaxID=433720 RepID=A0A813NY37_9BILA|nr:unnamed protein product [Adineta steineri]CAF3555587.1 unnamed protein product [Adineta steineri]
MPKYNFMISKAVDLVARKLAGMDTDTIARLTSTLSEEAQMISEELQYSGEQVDSEILAAKLEGVIARMKYEARNKGPDPSPYEFPIFNVSHNPESPYPNPINHLYDKRYKEAYSTFIKQNQPSSSPSQKTNPSTPTIRPQSPTTPSSPSSPKTGTASSNPLSHSNHSQGQYQQQQSHSQPSPQSPGFLPSLDYQQGNAWLYMSPYVIHHQNNNFLQQQQQQQQPQGSRSTPSISSNTQPLYRSSTADDLYSRSVSRSASNNDLDQSKATGKEQIRVRVINDSSASLADSQTDLLSNHQYQTQRSILKPSPDSKDNKDILAQQTMYVTPNTAMNQQAMQNPLKPGNNPQQQQQQQHHHHHHHVAQSSAASVPERVILVNRHASGPPHRHFHAPGKPRYYTYEARSSVGNHRQPLAVTGSSTPSTARSTTSSGVYASPQQNYYSGQQLFYQQPKVYGSTPNQLYSTASPYVPRVNGFYPFGYYHY